MKNGTLIILAVIMASCSKSLNKDTVTTPVKNSAQKIHYSNNFEDGNVSAETGISKVELMGANSQCIVVDNPDRSGFNTSARVLKSLAGFVDATKSNRSRSEISTQRVATNEKVHSYEFQVYLPADYFTGITFEWQYTSQFKTYPCHKADGTYEICDPEGGIFNDITFNANTFDFRYRAIPDCFTATPTVELGKWLDFKMDIYWTKSTNGWVKLYKNDVLVYSKTAMRTLFTDWSDGTNNSKDCNIYWAIGQYTRWFPNGTDRTHRVAYYDNIILTEK